MYQMTLFKKKGIYKIPRTPLAKGMASLCAVYCIDTCKFTFQKKILTPYEIPYTLLACMYKLNKDIKYMNPIHVLIACKQVKCIEN